MDILTILKTNSSDLLPEDLELFRTELAVGNYPEKYKRECAELMEQIQHWERPDEPETKHKEQDITSVIRVDVSELTPDGRKRNTIPFFSNSWRISVRCGFLTNTKVAFAHI